ncbi:hypothetical protein BIY26_05775 [Brenneria goodwinii]|uniref:Uncharacterized protein n=1 Tax=Brenneria goodwinii TaxID=1109412 RepID=A0AAE8ETB6_9GAMM|nr:hypothetical protein AWC36_15515 [Brenneria goodwinii]RLM25067.1 hypothetical protein BIY28_03665 [Brenneria goodwinii]RLM27660.1 hypothetical protein BIY26_05775 [Brenneria goodwinii]
MLFLLLLRYKLGLNAACFMRQIVYHKPPGFCAGGGWAFYDRQALYKGPLFAVEFRTILKRLAQGQRQTEFIEVRGTCR